MECYHCGQPNNEGAVYCKNCGQRVDGKTACPSCGRLIDCDSAFCENCGCNLSEAPSHPDVKDGQAIGNSFARNSALLKKKGEYCCNIFSLATAFFSLFFMFFIGVEFSSNVQLTNSGAYAMDYNLYYYFGECYKQLELLKGLDLETLVSSHVYFQAILGTLFSIAIIITTFAFAITTWTKYASFTKGNGDNSFSRYAIATYFSYIAGLILFCVYNSSYGYASDSIIKVSPNKYCIIGVILTTVFLIITVISRTAMQNRCLSTQKSVYKISFSALSITTLVLLVVFAASPMIIIVSKTNDINLNCNFFSAMSVVVYSFMAKEPTLSPITGILKYPDEPTGLYTMLVIAFVLQVAIIITVIISIAKRCNSISSDKNKNNYTGIGISLIIFMMSLAFAILTIAAESPLVDYLELDKDTVKTDMLPPIMVVLASVINLAVSAIDHDISHKIARQDD